MPKEDTQFKSGKDWKGNAGGRPKNTMKDFVQKMFQEMNDEQKAKWLKDNKITGIDQWKMGEGLPKQDMEVSGEITKKIVSIEE